MQHDERDLRLVHAYELLRSVIEDSTSPTSTAELPSHWHIDHSLPIDLDGRLSATDILGWWFRAPQGQENPWDHYFRGIQSKGVVPIDYRAASPQNALSTGTINDALPQHNINPELLNYVREVFAADDNSLSDLEADQVVDCLYRFLHALAQRDINTAFQEVSDEYHVIDEDGEVDILGFRQQCELLLDSLYGYDLDISLSEVPESIPHPSGVLIHATIQIDAQNKISGAKKSIVESRVAVFKKSQLRDTWQIHAFNTVTE